MSSVAAAAAVGSSHHPAGSSGALANFLQYPFGRIALAVVAVGLAGFGLWCAARAFSRHPHAATFIKSLLIRLDYLVGAGVHAALVSMAVQHLLGRRNQHDVTGDESTRTLVAQLMTYPLGQIIATMAGAYIVIGGVQQFYNAWTVDLDDLLDMTALRPHTRKLLHILSRVGLASRAVILGLFGMFIMLAAWHRNPSEARGLGGAIEMLALPPYGPPIFAAISGGLFAYAIYEFLRARYRRRHTM
jgi:hypothetical protein